MKKTISLLIVGVLTLMMISCTQEDSDPSIGTPPANVEIQATITGNSVEFTANADNAYEFYWDFDNGKTAVGENTEMSFDIADTYNVKCIAMGKGGQTVVTKSITTTIGNPDVYNYVNKVICGYSSLNNQSSAVWVWDHTAGAFACGGPEDPSTYFDPIDVTWWESGDNEMDGMGCYDDEYSFKINRKFDYINNSNGDFLYSWAWANELRGQTQAEYADVALEYTAPESSWETEKLGTGADTAWVLRITNNGWIGIANGTHEYQILEITPNTLWLRYDASLPADFTVSGTTKTEWGYLRLVKKVTR
ncbi:MAG: hypothetical protein EHM93_04430 [Bacteroidales bacterium]|nr:MAG: hypothetical protein EHM93_04430 [Bacteroidales bacterium]